MISLLKSRNGLRYYLFRGLALSVLLVCGIFLTGTWQIYRTGLQTLPKEAHADAAVVRERINHAITLYQSHRVGKIIFTGGTPKKGFMTEAEVGRRYALKQGIPAHNILFENTSRNTYENLRNIIPIMHANGVSSIIVVSDPYHLARAEEMAADLGLSDAQFSATPTTRFDERSKKAKFLMQESYSLFLYRIGKWSDAVWNWIGG